MPKSAIRSLSVKNKWQKTKWLMADPALRPLVPETKPFSREALGEMTRRYRMVYFKPTGGTGGGGIARIERTPAGRFRVKKDLKTSVEASIASLFHRLKRISRGKSYLLQKGIELQKAGGKPFDLRVMVQKSLQNRWVPTVMFVKVGKPGKVVTNYHQGGKLETVERALARAGHPPAGIRRYKRRLRTLGMRTARCFGRHSPRFRELGLDVALDRGGRLWILEVNTRPGYSALKSLPNKRLYRTVTRYGRNYGRR
ncbi:YheC/YheD family protein [Cohnella sp. JJ-181]|uniref:YheC/YheD family protein n=1 Tax=Cohnella rhizoplanae TaxID=2974897 RepID=UPI00232F2AA8|nr:YheC/YheD family protein [Cohnella sp. JJ-181]